MKHSLTALAALTAVVALPTLAIASPDLDFTVAPPPGVHLQVTANAPQAVVAAPALASAATLIYPDIPAKVTMDDHMAVLVPLKGAVTKTHEAAIIVPQNGDPSQKLASAEITYLASECPAVLSHPADHTAVLARFCQNGRG